MTMSSQGKHRENPKLWMEFVCPKCRSHLAWASETAEVQCRRCNRWVRAKDVKEINPARMVADDDERQLVLFL